jgi:hypothetical protein
VESHPRLLNLTGNWLIRFCKIVLQPSSAPSSVYYPSLDPCLISPKENGGGTTSKRIPCLQRGSAYLHYIRVIEERLVDWRVRCRVVTRRSVTPLVVLEPPDSCARAREVMYVLITIADTVLIGSFADSLRVFVRTSSQRSVCAMRPSSSSTCTSKTSTRPLSLTASVLASRDGTFVNHVR